MTTTLHDDRPAKAGRSSCGFCWAGQGQPPGKCRDRRSRRNGTYHGAVPALTLAVAMATLSRARVSSTLTRPWACIQQPACKLFQRVYTPPPSLHWRCIGYVASIPRVR